MGLFSEGTLTFNYLNDGGGGGSISTSKFESFCDNTINYIWNYLIITTWK